MSDFILTTGMLIGGLGLFLLAMNIITDNLKLAAGDTLRDLLSNWTRTPLRSLIAGFSITALVQSSSAVTVAVIGFVNAGLLTLHHAVGVVFGANIGTTMTGWIVALLGFKIDIQSFAIPMVGLGMVLHVTGGESKFKPIGLAISGFGLFFVGIDVLKDSFIGLSKNIDFMQFRADGISGVIIYVMVGFIMTLLTQSSSAAIVVTLTAVSSGLLGFYAAAAMVIGANIGTTSTAAFAVLGATPSAKRVAAAHVIFNVCAAIVALTLLPILFYVVIGTEKVIGKSDNPAVALALFHTVFNLIGVLLMLPVVNKLVAFLSQKFVTPEEAEENPKFLDNTILASPMLAANALSLELSRVTQITKRMMLDAISIDNFSYKKILNDQVLVQKLCHFISDFITKLGTSELTGEVSDKLTNALQAEHHILACVEQVHIIAKEHKSHKAISDTVIVEHLARFRAEAMAMFEMSDPNLEGFSYSACKTQLDKIQFLYDEIKIALLRATAEKRTPVSDVIEIIEQNRRIRYAAGQMLKSIRFLKGLYEEGGASDTKQSEAKEENKA